MIINNSWKLLKFTILATNVDFLIVNGPRIVLIFSKINCKWPSNSTKCFLDLDFQLLPDLDSSKLILSFQLIPKPDYVVVSFTLEF